MDLNRIRAKIDKKFTIQQKMSKILMVFALGAFLGFLAKYLDSVSLLGQIGTDLGLWILVATILAAWSRSPSAAAIHVFVFFLSMLIVYYTYSMVLFGFFPKYYFLAWGSIAMLSPIGAYIVWYSRGNGWPAVLCASIPIAVLLVEGHSFLYTFSISSAFDLLSAVLLLVIMPKSKLQRVRLLPVLILMFYIIKQFDLIRLFIGGL